MALVVPLQEDTPLFAGVVGGGERTPGSGFRAVLQGDRWTGSADAGGVARDGKEDVRQPPAGQAEEEPPWVISELTLGDPRGRQGGRVDGDRPVVVWCGVVACVTVHPGSQVRLPKQLHLTYMGA